MAQEKDHTSQEYEADSNKVIQSRFFRLAMQVARKYAYSRSRLFVLISQAFEKLQDKATQDNLKQNFVPKLSLFIRMLKAYASGSYRELPTSALIKVAAAVVYFVMAIDFIPDFIPILGFTDDLAVILWVYQSIDEQMEDFQKWESSSAKA